MASFSTSLTSSASGSLKLDIDEVRSQLLELGYPPMDDNQLRQFARDLKKLMKYELKQQRRQNYSTDSKSAEQTDGGLATSKDYSKDDLTDDEECTTSEDVVVRVIEKKSVERSGNKKQKVERPKKSVILPRIDSKAKLNGDLPTSLKCDPVTLYASYKAVWDRLKLPQDPKSTKNVRWCTKERLEES